MRLRVKVSEEAIECGLRGSPEGCPIALAIMSCCPSLHDIGVGTSSVNASSSEGKRYEAELPQVAEDFVAEFDRDYTVKPFEFDLFWKDWYLSEEKESE